MFLKLCIQGYEGTLQPCPLFLVTNLTWPFQRLIPPKHKSWEFKLIYFLFFFNAFFFNLILFFKLYIIVLVLPTIKMNDLFSTVTISHKSNSQRKSLNMRTKCAKKFFPFFLKGIPLKQKIFLIVVKYT